MTIVLAWNAEDAGKIIETYKIFESKPPDDIMERSDTAPHQKVIIILLIYMYTKNKKEIEGNIYIINIYYSWLML